MKIAVLGAGAWGTALALSISRKCEVSLYSSNAELARDIRKNKENLEYLPDVALPESVTVTNSLTDALDSSSFVVFAVPVKGLRQTLQACRLNAGDTKPYIITCKGFEQGSGLLPFQVLEAVIADYPYSVLSGPSFARDVGLGKPVTVSLATSNSKLFNEFSVILQHGDIRTYFNDDVLGVSLGGAVKNVIAIASGMAGGLGVGSSALAGLVTRGLSEMARLGIRLGAKSETFMGLSGIGDLFLTSFSDMSRNQRLGRQLANGRNLEEAEIEIGQITEGVQAAYEVLNLSKKLSVEMPITEAVVKVLSSELTCEAAAASLFARPNKKE